MARDLNIEFVGGHLPTASTCHCTLQIPTGHASYHSFKDYFHLAVKGHSGFGTA